MTDPQLAALCSWWRFCIRQGTQLNFDGKDSPLPISGSLPRNGKWKKAIPTALLYADMAEFVKGLCAAIHVTEYKDSIVPSRHDFSSFMQRVVGARRAIMVRKKLMYRGRCYRFDSYTTHRDAIRKHVADEVRMMNWAWTRLRPSDTIGQ